MQPTLPPRLGVLYAAGDVGPSLTSLSLAFFWLFYLTDVAGLPSLQAGLIHGSGFVFSAVASLAAGHWLDGHLRRPRARLALMSTLSVAMAFCFALLWTTPVPAVGRVAWYLVLSWLFHLLFALVYLSFLSIGGLVASGPSQRVQLNGYRFGGTMLLSVLLLGLYAVSDGRWPVGQRLSGLGAAVAGLCAVGGVLCGLGMRRDVPDRAPAAAEGQATPWSELAASRVLWWAVGGNLAVWFAVQTVLVLTIFLCAAAGVSDTIVLLALQLSIVAGTMLVSVAVRSWTADSLLMVSAALWCAGAFVWWSMMAPLPAAVLTGMGLGAATVLSWARLPDALDRHAAAAGQRADARVYAGLTLLRDLVAAIVPVLAGIALQGRAIGGPASGEAAIRLLITASLVAAILVAAIRLPAGPAVGDAGRAAAPR